MIIFLKGSLVNDTHRLIVKRKVVSTDPRKIYDFLLHHSPLSPSQVEEMLIKGAVWVRATKKKKLVRCYLASTKLCVGDWIEAYYSAKILSHHTLSAELIGDDKHWGGWFKPAGLMSQGTKYGDHCSLLRQVEKCKKQAYLIHRLDRETSGVVLVAYDKRGAQLLSQLFRKRQIKKTYLAQVVGNVSKSLGAAGQIDASLDGKKALTHFRVVHQSQNDSTIQANITTGRFHQVRRHFDMVGHPIIGDPRYGQTNKNQEGMKLVASSLEFCHPLSKEFIVYQSPKQHIAHYIP